MQNLLPQDILQIKGQILSLTQNHNRWVFVSITKKRFLIYISPFTSLWREKSWLQPSKLESGSWIHFSEGTTLHSLTLKGISVTNIPSVCIYLWPQLNGSYACEKSKIIQAFSKPRLYISLKNLLKVTVQSCPHFSFHIVHRNY